MPIASDNQFPKIIFDGQASTPSNPPSGYYKLYFKDDGNMYKLNSAGTETAFNAAGAGLVSTLMFTIDGGGSAISTGIKGDIVIDFACTINNATLLADQTGSIVLDLWKDTYANYPPTVADTITASAKPTLSSATKAQDNTLTGWTTSVTAGDIIRVNVDSAATVTRVLLALKVTRT